MKCIAAVFGILFLSGCASTGLTEKGETAYFEAQKQAASEPIMSISCPENGCQFQSLTVNNPGNNQIQSLRTTSPALEITKTIVNAATSVAPWAAVSHIAVEGIANASGNTSSVVSDSNNTTDASDRSSMVRDSNNSQQTTETVQTSERDDTFGDSASVVGRDSIGDNSGRNSGTSGRINSSDSDATSTPTVVEQPAPVVVQPQSPLPSNVQ